MKYKIMIAISIHGNRDYTLEEYDGIEYSEHDKEEMNKIIGILKRHGHDVYIKVMGE